MAERHGVIVIGAGGAGLSASYHLKRLGVPHTVLERGDVGNTWARERWDSFHLVNPNWALRLHGFEYRGPDPDGYLSRAHTVQLLQDYASLFEAPVRCGVEVFSLEYACPDGFILRTSAGDMQAEKVVVATGAFGPPAYPANASQISKRPTQLHSNHYLNAGELPPGGVLVVGSGQSGAQVMEDLFDAGRQVYLAVSKSGRRPRRYRGKDSSWWNNTMGGFDKTLNDVPSLDVRFGSSSHTSGTKGGHDIYLRAFARDGVRLLGRFEGADGERVRLGSGLRESLAAADEYATKWRKGVDRFVEEQGLDAPLEEDRDPPGLDRYPEDDPPLELDLREAGISTVIWATGFTYDFSWIKLPVAGDRGYPVQRRGVTAWPGLYFTGLHWMYSAKSAQFIGVGEDAQYVAEHMARRMR